LGVFKHVGDILIPEGIVDGNGDKFVEAGCDVGNGPFWSIFGEDSNEFKIFSFWLVEQFSVEDAAAEVLCLFYGLLIGDEINS
jgi:hypothetical protein